MAGNGAQVIGKVLDDLSVKVYNAKDLGSNIGMSLPESASTRCAFTPHRIQLAPDPSPQILTDHALPLILATTRISDTPLHHAGHLSRDSIVRVYLVLTSSTIRLPSCSERC